LSGINEGVVSVAVTSLCGEESLHFTGSGTLRRDSRGTHLDYTARDREGNTVRSSVHLGMGRAVVDTGAYRLLLDPSHPTGARIPVEGGALELTVTAHRVHADLDGSDCAIILHYTLSALGRPLQEMHLTLTLGPIETER